MSSILATHKTSAIVAGVLIALILLVAAVAMGKKVSPVAWGMFGPADLTDGLALEGHDPVSYREGAPAPGSAEYELTSDRATYRFVSAENRDAFAADPAAFRPAFGGFCAFAVSKGFTAHADPTAYALLDGQLLVFADEGMRENFLADAIDNAGRARARWATRK